MRMASYDALSFIDLTLTVEVLTHNYYGQRFQEKYSFPLTVHVDSASTDVQRAMLIIRIPIKQYPFHS